MPEATFSGEPDAGNPYVLFDEGKAKDLSYSTGSVAFHSDGKSASRVQMCPGAFS
jgi:hypothetical protein